MNRCLEHRRNNAYDTILLVEDGRVIGEWETDGNDRTFVDYLSSGDLDDWAATWPDATDPDDYGKLVSRKRGGVWVDHIGTPLPYHCEKCGAELHHDRVVWLDLNIDTGEFSLEPWPIDKSQGCFEFGKACAEAVLAGNLKAEQIWP